MATSPSITRRAAIVGAAASTVALAVPAVAAINTKLGTSDQLVMLANEFYERAKLIDPTIRGAWFGTDLEQDHRGQFQSVTFVRGENKAYDLSRARRKAAGLA